eukprot:3847600-Ditylum_brightwellii.AAC.1
MDNYKTNEEDYIMYPYLQTWDDVYDMDSQIVAPMHTMEPTPDFIFVSPEKPVECWTTLECRQYLKLFALPSGKTDLDTIKKAAGFYHDSSVCKVPPEERVGK